MSNCTSSDATKDIFKADVAHYEVGLPSVPPIDQKLLTPHTATLLPILWPLIASILHKATLLPIFWPLIASILHRLGPVGVIAYLVIMSNHGVFSVLVGLACSFEFPFSKCLVTGQRQALELLIKRFRLITAFEACEHFSQQINRVVAFHAADIESWLGGFLLLIEDRLYCTELLSVHEGGSLL